MGRKIPRDRNEDVPAGIDVAPRHEFPNSCLQHLESMEVRIFAQLSLPKTSSGKFHFDFRPDGRTLCKGAARTHLSLGKDAPVRRTVQRAGPIEARPVVLR
jgi:hypothetical protein